MALSDDIIAYWKLDESSGNAADSKGSNTGTNTNVTYGASKINNGAVFNGTNAYLTCTRISALESVGAFTISGWFKQTTIDQSRSFFTKGEGGGSNGIALFSNSNGFLYLEPASSSNRGYIDYSAYMSADTWTHVVVVFNGSGTGNAGRLKIYFNGTERTLTYDGTIPTASASATANFELGRETAGNRFFWDGGMDEVGIWTRALSGSEVSELYNSGDGFAYPFTVPLVPSTIYLKGRPRNRYDFTGISLG
jgi:trimeric autotransporter adhesin